MSPPEAPKRPADVVTGAMLAVAVAVLPVSARARYREEWAADVVGAAEVGLSPRRVAVGSLATALQLSATTPRGRSPMAATSPHHRARPGAGRTPTAVLGLMVGAVVGAVLAIAFVLVVGLWVMSERQVEGTLVVALPLGAVLGSAVGRALALRVLGHSPSRGLLPVGMGLLGAIGSLVLLGSTVPPDLLNAYGVLLLPAVVLLTLVVCAAAGEALGSRATRPHART